MRYCCEKPSELLLMDSTKGKLRRLYRGPTAQIYCDGVESSLETLEVFSDDRGKIPAARNEDHSLKRGKSASYCWIGTAQLEQVKERVVEEVENLLLIDEELVLMRTEREIYFPPSCALKQ